MDGLTYDQFMRLPPAHRSCVTRSTTYVALADAIGTPRDKATAQFALILSVSAARLHLMKEGAL